MASNGAPRPHSHHFGASPPPAIDTGYRPGGGGGHRARRRPGLWSTKTDGAPKCPQTFGSKRGGGGGSVARTVEWFFRRTPFRTALPKTLSPVSSTYSFDMTRPKSLFSHTVGEDRNATTNPIQTDMNEMSQDPEVILIADSDTTDQISRIVLIAGPEHFYHLALQLETSPDLDLQLYGKDLFIRAAGLGYAPAQFKLGICYELGLTHFPTDPSHSFAWYKRAALQGHADAELAVSGWYLTGHPQGLVQSEPLAYEWASKAARRGWSKAEYTLGHYHEVGIGVPQDLQIAKQWYLKAAARGNERALLRLLVGHVGLAVDYAHLKDALLHHNGSNPYMIHQLAQFHELREYGLVPDEDAAFELYAASAQANYAPAQYKLGSCYEFGILGCPQDPVQAVRWYSQGAENGQVEALLALAGFYLDGSAGNAAEQSDEEAFRKERTPAADLNNSPEPSRMFPSLAQRTVNGHFTTSTSTGAEMAWMTSEIAIPLIQERPQTPALTVQYQDSELKKTPNVTTSPGIREGIACAQGVGLARVVSNLWFENAQTRWLNIPDAGNWQEHLDINVHSDSVIIPSYLPPAIGFTHQDLTLFPFDNACSGGGLHLCTEPHAPLDNGANGLLMTPCDSLFDGSGPSSTVSSSRSTSLESMMPMMPCLLDDPCWDADLVLPIVRDTATPESEKKGLLGLYDINSASPILMGESINALDLNDTFLGQCLQQLQTHSPILPVNGDSNAKNLAIQNQSKGQLVPDTAVKISNVVGASNGDTLHWKTQQAAQEFFACDQGQGCLQLDGDRIATAAVTENEPLPDLVPGNVWSSSLTNAWPYLHPLDSNPPSLARIPNSMYDPRAQLLPAFHNFWEVGDEASKSAVDHTSSLWEYQQEPVWPVQRFDIYGISMSQPCPLAAHATDWNILSNCEISCPVHDTFDECQFQRQGQHRIQLGYSQDQIGEQGECNDYSHGDEYDYEYDYDHDYDNLVPAPSTLKRRRRLSANETAYLVQQFRQNEKPNAQERQEFAKHLDLDRRTIQVWFQNRRAKLKRDETATITAVTLY
ncbi:hypothetical protein BG004_005821 [Podila humilis]|nr:hypothetical protein BG004_005821 [Podila humilis]